MEKPRSRFKNIFIAATTVRFAILLLSITSDYLLVDHDTSTVIHLKEIGAEELLGKNSMVYHVHKALVRYDAFFFLKHAHEGHSVEKNFAFFPGYSQALRAFTKGSLRLNPLASAELVEEYFEVFLITHALVLNFAFGVASVLLLYKLSWGVLGSESMAYKSALLFTINPATVFHLAPYTAAMFSAVSLFGLAILYPGSRWRLPGWMRVLCSSVVLMYSVGIRSNGLFFAAIVGYVIFLKLVGY